MLYQLSNIGQTLPSTAASAHSLRFAVIVRMQHILAPHPALERKHPRISSVSNRIRGSLSVVYASAPKTRYAINAIAKRLIIPAALKTVSTNSGAAKHGAQGRIRTFVPR